MTVDGHEKASANPTKAFFVNMITRDITLEDCILDLIDNSVDGAWESEGSRPMGLADGTDLSKYSIRLYVSADTFRILDNCGGMTLDDAIEHAFGFGRRVQEGHDDYSIGVYGIGMKRAVFKIGTEIRVRSTFAEDSGGRLSFVVPIRVSEWLANDDPPWDFDIESAEDLDENGVEIVVTGLTAGATNSFGSPAFIQNLYRTIARDYSLHLNRGLKIYINDKPIEGWRIELRQSEDYAPMRLEYSDSIDGTPVSVEIIGGMAAAPPETSDPQEEAEGDRRFGWYVVCNGRIVLAADKTKVSGWGTEDWPQWHYQYSGFIGIILFTAANAASLPLTTTKRSVDTTSEVYLRARPRMREVSKKWIGYTNQRKQALEQAKEIEAKANAVSIYEVTRRDSVSLPDFTITPTERRANINYSVPVKKLKNLAKAFGKINMTYRDVGIKSFDYAYDDLAEDD